MCILNDEKIIINRLGKKPRMSMKLGNECYGLNAPKSHVLKLSPHCGSVTYKGKTIMNWASERD